MSRVSLTILAGLALAWIGTKSMCEAGEKPRGAVCFENNYPLIVGVAAYRSTLGARVEAILEDTAVVQPVLHATSD